MGLRLRAYIPVLTMIASVSSSAQETKSSSTRLNCVSAAHLVSHSQDETLVADAYGVLLHCRDAAATLALVWRTPPADSTGLMLLARRSAQIADRRIVDAILPIVQNGGFSSAIRRAALDVTLAQYNRKLVIGVATWNDPEHASLARETDYFQMSGEQPVTAVERNAIVDALRKMSASDTDDRLRRVAARVLTDLGVKP